MVGNRPAVVNFYFTFIQYSVAVFTVPGAGPAQVPGGDVDTFVVNAATTDTEPCHEPKREGDTP